MTGDYAIILPLMISNVISYTVAARLHPVPIYDALLRQDGVPMPEHQTHRDLRGLTVEQAMRTDLPLASVSGTIGEAASQFEKSGARLLAVVDGAGHLQGVVGRRELRSAGTPSTSIVDVMRRDVITVFPDQSLDLALLKLDGIPFARPPSSAGERRGWSSAWCRSRTSPRQSIDRTRLDANPMKSTIRPQFPR